jgi:hypothetical protein
MPIVSDCAGRIKQGGTKLNIQPWIPAPLKGDARSHLQIDNAMATSKESVRSDWEVIGDSEAMPCICHIIESALRSA